MMKRLMAAAAVATLATGLVGFSEKAHAVLFGFEPISNNSGVSDELAEQFWVDVTDSGGGTVQFQIFNDDAFDLDESNNIDSTITDIYFDDNASVLDFSVVSITDSDGAGTGVSFSSPACPGDLPGGNTVSFMADYSAQEDQGGITAGVDDGVGEWVAFTIDLAGIATYADVLAAMGAETLRVGLHVQSIGLGGQSDAFVSVPVPAAAWLFLTGIAGLAGFRRFKSRAAA